MEVVVATVAGGNLTSLERVAMPPKAMGSAPVETTMSAGHGSWSGVLPAASDRGQLSIILLVT